MNNLKFNYFFIIINILFFLSCSVSSDIYAPNSINTPLFKDKKEFQMVLLAKDKTNDEQTSYAIDLQMAYAFHENFAFLINGQNIYQNKPENNYSIADEYKLNYIEMAPGYFTNFGNIIFEIYGGYGLGNINLYTDNDRAELNFNKFFIQPSIGKSTKYIDFAFSSKISFLAYNKVDFKEYTDQGLLSLPNFFWKEKETIIEEMTYPFIEPALTFRLGYKQIKIMGQLGMSLNTKDIEFDYSKLYFTLGVHINFSKRFLN